MLTKSELDVGSVTEYVHEGSKANGKHEIKAKVKPGDKRSKCLPTFTGKKKKVGPTYLYNDEEKTYTLLSKGIETSETNNTNKLGLSCAKLR